MIIAQFEADERLWGQATLVMVAAVLLLLGVFVAV
jgi:hypothetical protein